MVPLTERGLYYLNDFQLLVLVHVKKVGEGVCAVPHAWRSEDKSVESGLCIYLSLGSRAGAQVPTMLALQESLPPEMSLTSHTFLLKNKKKPTSYLNNIENCQLC